ncbi:MAG: LysM domain-containing protein [Acidimicrobiia bacterium]
MDTYALNPSKVSAFELYKRSYDSPRQGLVSVSSRVNSLRSQPLTVLNERKTAKKTINIRRVFILALVLATFLAITLPAAKAFGRRSLVSTERQTAVDLSQQIQRNQTVSVVVKPGDNLWSIARRLEPNKDPRNVVDQLVKARGTTSVIVGETIQWSR